MGTDTKVTPPTPRRSGPGDEPPGGRSRPDGAGPGGPPPNGFRPGQQKARVGERTNEAWADQKVGFYYAVVDAMLKTGFTPDEMGKIGGGNFLRVFEAAVRK